MNWLITGGCGFVGTALVKNLVEEGGHFIRVVDNLSVGNREDLARVCEYKEIDSKKLDPQASTMDPDSSFSLVELIVADILDYQLALEAVQEIDVIVHLAANTGVQQSVKNPLLDCNVNVTGTLNYMEAARHNGVSRFVFASSGAPVGESEAPIHEEIVPHPVSPYGASKLAGEGYCSAYYRTFGLETVVLRFGNVYGPGSQNKESVVAKFIRQAINSEELEIYGDGNQTRDFIYIDDLIRAVRSAAEMDGVSGEVFQIATFRETTINEIAIAIRDIVAKEIDNMVSIIHRNPRKGDINRSYSDISKARNILGYEPKFDINRGLKETFRYLMTIR